ncbi:MAG: LysM peptidoglycan-binding domain-containing protein, partial [Bacteroidales bacterium]|nr:LysM peptidoglycan-binding domain-containing protein [Bacteroidales bacterium]
MKKLIFVLMLGILGAGAAHAQEYVPTPVTVSNEKVRMNGKTYLSHVVLERQTLFSIAKAYGVSVTDI